MGTLANDLSYRSINRSQKLSDGPGLGPHQIVKQGKGKLLNARQQENLAKLPASFEDKPLPPVQGYVFHPVNVFLKNYVYSLLKQAKK